MVRCIVTSNVDGLHRLSGVPPDRLAELYGNIFIEVLVPLPLGATVMG